jgi:prepilin-type N-terminal cleavage/methylation domain-containing protein
MENKGFTTIELVIAIVIIGILGVIGIGAITGNSSIFSSKQACLDAGGKWTEGIQYGRMTQLCTYN